jgi:hypothetical protein
MNSKLLESQSWHFEHVPDDAAVTIAAEVERFVPEIQKWQATAYEIGRRALPFYRDYELIRIAETSQSDRVLWGLYAPGHFVPLDGWPDGIYQVNRVSPLTLNPETARDYAILLLAFVMMRTGNLDFRVQAAGNGFIVVLPSWQFAVGSNGMLQKNFLFQAPPIAAVRPILDVKRWKLEMEESDERARILKNLQWEAGEDEGTETLIRRAEIGFYREHRLYEVLQRRKLAARFQQYYFLISAEQLLPLYGESQPIHEVNGRSEALSSSEQAEQYLRFFSSAIRGAEGRFLIIERLREIPWRDAPPDKMRNAIIPKLIAVASHEVTEEGSGERTWEFEANVCYGSHLFLARFAVRSKGMVEMKGDTEIVEKLAVEDYRMLNPTEYHLTSDREPETYLDECGGPADGAAPCAPDELVSAIEESNARNTR